MTTNLSFPGSGKSTGKFYSDIHATMSDRAGHDGLPPTSVEFAEWLEHNFHTAPGMAALDCGCGAHAFNSLACKRAGFEVEAIDVNAAAARTLDGSGVRFSVGSVLDLPFPDDTFDLVICSGVAHHTENPGRAFREIRRVLKPNGTAYISLYTFRRSAMELVVRALRFAARYIPYNQAQRLASKSRLLNNFVLDHMYVPILHIFSDAEAKSDLDQSGLYVQRNWPTSFDRFSRWPLGFLISGDGLLSVYVCGKHTGILSDTSRSGTRCGELSV